MRVLINGRTGMLGCSGCSRLSIVSIDVSIGINHLHGYHFNPLHGHALPYLVVELPGVPRIDVSQSRKSHDLYVLDLAVGESR